MATYPTKSPPVLDPALYPDSPPIVSRPGPAFADWLSWASDQWRDDFENDMQWIQWRTTWDDYGKDNELAERERLSLNWAAGHIGAVMEKKVTGYPSGDIKAQAKFFIHGKNSVSSIPKEARDMFFVADAWLEPKGQLLFLIGVPMVAFELAAEGGPGWADHVWEKSAQQAVNLATDSYVSLKISKELDAKIERLAQIIESYGQEASESLIEVKNFGWKAEAKNVRNIIPGIKAAFRTKVNSSPTYAIAQTQENLFIIALNEAFMSVQLTLGQSGYNLPNAIAVGGHHWTIPFVAETYPVFAYPRTMFYLKNMDDIIFCGSNLNVLEFLDKFTLNKNPPDSMQPYEITITKDISSKKDRDNHYVAFGKNLVKTELQSSIQRNVVNNPQFRRINAAILKKARNEVGDTFLAGLEDFQAIYGKINTVEDAYKYVYNKADLGNLGVRILKEAAACPLWLEAVITAAMLGAMYLLDEDQLINKMLPYLSGLCEKNLNKMLVEVPAKKGTKWGGTTKQMIQNEIRRECDLVALYKKMQQLAKEGDTFAKCVSDKVAEVEDLIRNPKINIQKFKPPTKPKIGKKLKTFDIGKMVKDEFMKALTAAAVVATVYTLKWAIEEAIAKLREACQPDTSTNMNAIMGMANNNLENPNNTIDAAAEGFGVLDLEALQAFLMDVSALITPAELCSLFDGEASQNTLIAIKQLQQVKYPTLRKNFPDITVIRSFFLLLGEHIDKEACHAAVKRTGQISHPELCDDTADLPFRRDLLEGRATEEQINDQLKKLAQKQVDLLSELAIMISSDNPVSDKLTVQPTNPNADPSVQYMAKKVLNSIFRAIGTSFDKNIVSYHGFLKRKAFKLEEAIEIVKELEEQDLLGDDLSLEDQKKAAAILAGEGVSVNTATAVIARPLVTHLGDTYSEHTSGVENLLFGGDIATSNYSYDTNGTYHRYTIGANSPGEVTFLEYWSDTGKWVVKSESDNGARLFYSSTTTTSASSPSEIFSMALALVWSRDIGGNPSPIEAGKINPEFQTKILQEIAAIGMPHFKESYHESFMRLIAQYGRSLSKSALAQYSEFANLALIPAHVPDCDDDETETKKKGLLNLEYTKDQTIKIYNDLASKTEFEVKIDEFDPFELAALEGVISTMLKFYIVEFCIKNVFAFSIFRLSNTLGSNIIGDYIFEGMFRDLAKYGYHIDDFKNEIIKIITRRKATAIDKDQYHSSFEEEHMHTIEIDENGNGKTTISFGNPRESDHVHDVVDRQIVAYTDEEGDTHTHSFSNKLPYGSQYTDKNRYRYLFKEQLIDCSWIIAKYISRTGILRDNWKEKQKLRDDTLVLEQRLLNYWYDLIQFGREGTGNYDVINVSAKWRNLYPNTLRKPRSVKDVSSGSSPLSLYSAKLLLSRSYNNRYGIDYDSSTKFKPDGLKEFIRHYQNDRDILNTAGSSGNYEHAGAMRFWDETDDLDVYGKPRTFIYHIVDWFQWSSLAKVAIGDIEWGNADSLLSIQEGNPGFAGWDVMNEKGVLLSEVSKEVGQARHAAGWDVPENWQGWDGWGSTYADSITPARYGITQKDVDYLRTMPVDSLVRVVRKAISLAIYAWWGTTYAEIYNANYIDGGFNRTLADDLGLFASADEQLSLETWEYQSPDTKYSMIFPLTKLYDVSRKPNLSETRLTGGPYLENGGFILERYIRIQEDPDANTNNEWSQTDRYASWYSPDTEADNSEKTDHLIDIVNLDAWEEYVNMVTTAASGGKYDKGEVLYTDYFERWYYGLRIVYVHPPQTSPSTGANWDQFKNLSSLFSDETHAVGLGNIGIDDNTARLRAYDKKAFYIREGNQEIFTTPLANVEIPIDEVYWHKDAGGVLLTSASPVGIVHHYPKEKLIMKLSRDPVFHTFFGANGIFPVNLMLTTLSIYNVNYFTSLFKLGGEGATTKDPFYAIKNALKTSFNALVDSGTNNWSSEDDSALAATAEDEETIMEMIAKTPWLILKGVLESIPGFGWLLGRSGLGAKVRSALGPPDKIAICAAAPSLIQSTSDVTSDGDPDWSEAGGPWKVYYKIPLLTSAGALVKKFLYQNPEYNDTWGFIPVTNAADPDGPKVPGTKLGWIDTYLPDPAGIGTYFMSAQKVEKLYTDWLSDTGFLSIDAGGGEWQPGEEPGIAASVIDRDYITREEYEHLALEAYPNFTAGPDWTDKYKANFDDPKETDLFTVYNKKGAGKWTFYKYYLDIKDILPEGLWSDLGEVHAKGLTGADDPGWAIVADTFPMYLLRSESVSKEEYFKTKFYQISDPRVPFTSNGWVLTFPNELGSLHLPKATFEKQYHKRRIRIDNQVAHTQYQPNWIMGQKSIADYNAKSQGYGQSQGETLVLHETNAEWINARDLYESETPVADLMQEIVKSIKAFEFMNETDMKVKIGLCQYLSSTYRPDSPCLQTINLIHLAENYASMPGAAAETPISYRSIQIRNIIEAPYGELLAVAGVKIAKHPNPSPDGDWNNNGDNDQMQYYTENYQGSYGYYDKKYWADYTKMMHKLGDSNFTAPMGWNGFKHLPEQEAQPSPQKEQKSQKQIEAEEQAKIDASYGQGSPISGDDPNMDDASQGPPAWPD